MAMTRTKALQTLFLLAPQRHLRGVACFDRRPHTTQPASNIEAAYQKADHAIQRIIDLLAA